MDWPHWFRYMFVKWKWKSLSHVRFFATPWTVAHQDPLSMESPGKNTGLGCHFLLQGIFPTQGLSPGSSALQADSLPTEPPGRPLDICLWVSYHERGCCVLSCTVGAKIEELASESIPESGVSLKARIIQTLHNTHWVHRKVLISAFWNKTANAKLILFSATIDKGFEVFVCYNIHNLKKKEIKWDFLVHSYLFLNSKANMLLFPLRFISLNSKGSMGSLWFVGTVMPVSDPSLAKLPTWSLVFWLKIF